MTGISRDFLTHGLDLFWHLRQAQTYTMAELGTRL